MLGNSHGSRDWGTDTFECHHCNPPQPSTVVGAVPVLDSVLLVARCSRLIHVVGEETG